MRRSYEAHRRALMFLAYNEISCERIAQVSQPVEIARH
jgi:hypothetical protein